MDAFFLSGESTDTFFSPVVTPGFRLIGQLELDAGSYIVVGKANIGMVLAEHQSSNLTDGIGILGLSFGGKEDIARVALKPLDGANVQGGVTVMTAAQIDYRRHARLYFLARENLLWTVDTIRLAAVRVDNLHRSVGIEQHNGLPDEELPFRIAESTHVLSTFGGAKRNP
jgi:hypothetical protein